MCCSMTQYYQVAYKYRNSQVNSYTKRRGRKQDEGLNLDIILFDLF